MLQSRENIINELKDICPSIASNEAINVYSVPNVYFEQLAGKILQRIAQNQTGLSFLGGKPSAAYQVPDNYFDGLAGSVLQKISQQGIDYGMNELESVAPFLLTVSKQMPYSVPPGYFDTAVTAPVKTGSNKIEARPVIELKHYFKYAVAAAVIGIIAITAYLFAPAGNLSNNNSPQQASVASAVNNVSDNEIIDYLNKSILVPDVSSLVSPNTTQAEIDDYIQKASDEDIKNFLNDHDIQGIKKNKEG